jgi:hypothetical protein
MKVIPETRHAHYVHFLLFKSIIQGTFDRFKRLSEIIAFVNHFCEFHSLKI